MKLKIVHAGDIQIEITTSGIGAQRFHEFDKTLNDFIQQVKTIQPDIVYLAGDMFQVNNPNGDETKMFGRLLHSLLPNTKRIVVIPGNHDVKQRNNVIMENAQQRVLTDPIESVISNINNPKITYYKHTGLYYDPRFELTWAVWSQIDKWSPEDKPYSPWVENKLPSGACIELYHDPIKNCLNFNGTVQKGAENSEIYMNTFKANTILAGDIHNPQIIQKENKTFAYCSSLVQRDFGEANYYDDLNLTVRGNDKHGFNVVDFDTELNAVTNIKFIALKPHVARHTIRLSKLFNYDAASLIDIEPAKFNYVKFVVDGNVHKFIEHRETLYSALSSKYDVKFELPEFSVDSVNDDNIEQIDNLEELITKDKIIELGEKYINSAVVKTSILNEHNREQARKVFVNLFKSELEKIDISAKYTNISLVDLHINNFMSFGNDNHFVFDNVPLTRILGSNGTGKTTIYYAIAFLISDFVLSTQSARSQKSNYLSYFNDRLTDDSVELSMTFYVNNELHKLTKTITRSWKGKQSHALDKDWRSYVSGVSYSVSLESPSLTSTDSEAVNDYLRTNVMNIDEFERLLFINAATLNGMLHKKQEDLNQQILSDIGLNFFDAMDAQYESVRSTMMAKVTKPLTTIEEIHKTKSSINEEIPLLQEKIDALTKQNTKIEEEIKLLEEDIREKTKKLKNVRKVDEINEEIDGLKLNIDTYTSSITLRKSEIDNIQNSIINANSENEKLAVEISKLELEKSKQEVLKSEHAAKLSRIQDQISSERDNAKNVIAAVKAELSNDVNNIKMSISESSNKLTKLQSDQQSIEHQFSTSISEQIDLVNAQISSERDIISTLQSAISDSRLELSKYESELAVNKQKRSELETRISELRNSEVCSECNRKYDEDFLHSIEDKVLAIQKQIEEIKIDNTEIESIKSDINKKQSEIELRKTEITKLNQKIELIKEYDIDDSEFAEQYANCTEYIDRITAEIDALKTKQIEAESKLLNDLKTNERVVSATEKVKTLQSEYDELQNVEYDTKIAEIESELTSLKSKKIDVDVLRTKIDDIRTEINKLETSITVANNRIADCDTEIVHAKEDEVIQTWIDSQQIELASRRSAIKQNDSESYVLRSNIEKRTDDLKRCDIDIKNIEKYEIVDAVVKLYKRLVGKNGLQQYIFDHIKPVINTKLNELLEGVPFRLFIDETSAVQMIDLTKNVVRPVTFASGAEKIFCGLALFATKSRMSTAKKFNVLLIDELSGALNDGKKLDYDAKNYQEEFIKIINRIKETVNVIIIDHVIDEINENKTVIVEKTENGSVIRVK